MVMWGPSASASASAPLPHVSPPLRFPAPRRTVGTCAPLQWPPFGGFFARTVLAGRGIYYRGILRRSSAFPVLRFFPLLGGEALQKGPHSWGAPRQSHVMPSGYKSEPPRLTTSRTPMCTLTITSARPSSPGSSLGPPTPHDRGGIQQLV